MGVGIPGNTTGRAGGEPHAPSVSKRCTSRPGPLTRRPIEQMPCCSYRSGISRRNTGLIRLQTRHLRRARAPQLPSENQEQTRRLYFPVEVRSVFPVFKVFFTASRASCAGRQGIAVPGGPDLVDFQIRFPSLAVGFFNCGSPSARHILTSP